MSEPLLAFREVDVFYGVIQALKQVSLEVNKGETVALIGAALQGRPLERIFNTHPAVKRTAIAIEPSV